MNDPMAILKEEMNKKRKSTSEIINQTNGELRDSKIRYFRQIDLLRIEQEKKIELQKQLERNEQKLNLNQNNDQILDKSTRNNSNNNNNHNNNNDEDNNNTSNNNNDNNNNNYNNLQENELINRLSNLTDEEVKNRLRSLGHPITLFGESSSERVRRLASAQSRELEEDDYKLTAAGHGMSSYNIQDEEKKNQEFDDDENDKEADGASSSFIRGNIKTNYSKTSGLTSEKIIYKYFRNLLKQWEWDLDDRDDYTKQTAKGKMETKTQKQCKDYIRPLFKLCKRQEVPEDILQKLVKIVEFCEEGNFRMAHDEYLQAAIGNSAWPIGLTMVGIHERSGREKISTSKVAHVMNNEMQRKYFTSVKRLMTYAQTKRTDIPPSMKSL